jgi:hypothetical protein
MKRFMIFLRHAHPVIYFVHAEDTLDAIRTYIQRVEGDAILQSDGSCLEDGVRYPHPLAYIEATEKTCGEWQIRELPDWAWEDDFTEVFCGESEDGPRMVIDDCRPLFESEFGRRRAKAFLWYLEGLAAVVTFYQRGGPSRIKVLRRYLHRWDGKGLVVEPWEGDYDDIVANLKLLPPRGHP